MTTMSENNDKTLRHELIEMAGDDKILLAVIESICAYTAQLDSFHKIKSCKKIYKRTDRKRHSRCKTKAWSEERRQKARQRALGSRPWEKSTGPCTSEGREKSKMNSLKNGGRSATARDVFAALQAQRRFIRVLNAQLELESQYPEFSGYGPKRDFML